MSRTKKSILTLICTVLWIILMTCSMVVTFVKAADEPLAESVENENILTLDTHTVSNWRFTAGNGTSVGGGKLTAANSGADGESPCIYQQIIKQDAVHFMFKADASQPEGEKVNTMWSIRAEYNRGGAFSAFTGYHIVLYPNRSNGQILCITNPNIGEYGNTTNLDLKGTLFDGQEHSVVVGATDKADGTHVYIDVDGKNFWQYIDPLVEDKTAVAALSDEEATETPKIPHIAKTGTSFTVGHRDEGVGCEQLNYAIYSPEDFVPEQKKPTISDSSNITLLPTRNSEDWTNDNDGAKVANGMLTASSTGGDGISPCRYTNEITTDAVQFNFQSYGTIQNLETANTMWTVRAQKGVGNTPFDFTGYHIVLYPNRLNGQILCITNPDIAERGNTTNLDLKGLLFDGLEHKIVVGAIDREDGVYVFLDVDGQNVWGFTDELKEGQPRIAKEGTSFTVGHRDEGTGCEQLNYYINYQAVAMPEYTTYDLQPKDFAKNNWELYQNISVADESIICNSTNTHAMAKYKGSNYAGENAVRFQLKISNVKDKLMFCLRSNRDKGGEMYWNGKMICVRFNLTDYDIIFNHIEDENHVRVPKSGALKTPLETNHTYLVEVGSVDTAEGTLVFLYIDDVLQFTYTDTHADRVTVTEPSTFKIGSYDESSFLVTAVGADEKGANLDRADNALAEKEITNENWANLLNAYNPDLVKDGEKTLVMNNKGGIAYAECLKVSQIDFDFQFTNCESTVQFMFNKNRRGTYFNQYLQQQAYWSNMGYAVSLNVNGNINVQKATQSDIGMINTLKSIWAEPFGSTKHHLTVTFAVAEGTNEATIGIFVDGALAGYAAVDSACSETYRQGYIGFQKMEYDGVFTVSAVRYTGEAVDTTEGKNTEVKNVYLAQFYESGKHDFAAYEGKNVLRWSYTKDSDYLKNVVVKVGGETLYTVQYPTNVVEIADEYIGQEAQIILNTVDGTSTAWTMVLEDAREDYEVDEARYNDRIAVRENNVTGFAEFYYNDGSTPAAQSRRFMPIGSNYLLLKDSWEASAFDASPNVTLNNYDPMEVEAMLALMAKNNYNAVRMFMGGGASSYSIGGMAGGPNAKDSDFYKIDGKKAYYIPYMNNLTDFMARSQKYGIYNLFVLGVGCPHSEYFSKYIGNIRSINAYLLEDRLIEGKEEFARTFVQYFKDYDAEHGTKLINSIFAISNDNESSFSAKTWPFNAEGSVTLANGKTYDMTVKADRQNAADEGKIYFYDRFVKAVKGVDPQILTCEGMYTLFAVNNYNDANPEANYGLTPLGDSSDSFPTTLDIMMKSELDFFDVHVYHTTGKELLPVFGENMRSLKYNEEVVRGQAQKPIIMAEFGAFRSKAPTWEEGQQIIKEQQAIALGEGYHFQGSITWQINEFKQTELYAMLEGDAEFFEGDLRYIYLEKAEVLTDGAKTSYKPGESLSLAGLKIKCFMSDGSAKEVAVGSDMLWNEDDIDLSVEGKKTVELLFEDSMILTYEITVEKEGASEEPDPGPGPNPGEKDPPVNPPEEEEPNGGCRGSVASIWLAVAAATFAVGATLAYKGKRSRK